MSYDDIRDQISWPLSLYVNIGGALAIMAFVAGFGGFEPGLFLQESNVFSPDVGLVLANLDQVGASVLLLGLILGTSWGFLQLFEREVAQIDATDEDAAGTE